MKKIIAFSLVFVFAFVAVCLPVSADTNTDGIYTATLRFPVAETNYFGFALYETSFDNNSFQQYRAPSAVTDEVDTVQYVLGLPDSYNGTYYGALVLGVSSLGTGGYFPHDSLYWSDPFKLSWQFGRLADSEATIDKWRLSLRMMTTSGITYVVATSPWVTGLLPNSYTLSVPKCRFTLNDDVDTSALVLCFDYHCDVTDPVGEFDNAQAVRFYVRDGGIVTLNYSLPTNPNAPNFSNPDNTLLDQNSQLEGEVLEGVDGLELEDNSSTLFDSIGTSIATFSNGLNFARVSLNLFIEDIPWIRDFVQVSLALGITATLLGLAGSIIGSATRRKGGKD